MAKPRMIATGIVVGFGVLTFGSLVVGGVVAWQKATETMTASCGCGQGIIVPASHTWWPTLVLFAAALGLGFRAGFTWYRQRRAVQKMRRDFSSLGTIWIDDGGAAPYGFVATDEPFAVTVGWWHSTIFISRGLRQRLTPNELAVVVAHERAHVRAHHPFWSRVVQVVGQTFFSWSWLETLVLMSHTEQEVSADAVAGQGTMAVSSLASAMMKLNLEPQHVGVAWSTLEARVDHLLNPDDRGRWPRAVLLAVVGVMVATGIVFSASWGAVKAAEPVLMAMPSCHELRHMCTNNALQPPMTTLQTPGHAAP